MSTTLKDNVQSHIVAAGDYSMVAAGLPLFTAVGTGRRARLIYNVNPGQIVAYTISGGVATTVDATLSASDLYSLFIGVGYDGDGDGVTDDIRYFGAEDIHGCIPREVSTSSPKCGNPQVVDLYFDCTQCDETYSVIVRIDDNQTQSLSPWNKSFSEFVGSIVTKCSSCGDCPVEHNCKEIACKLADSLNNELDIKVANREYPDWRGKGLPRPYYATRLHSSSYIYCLAPQTVSGSCEDCTYIDVLTGVEINGTAYQFVGNSNPADSTQTLYGQVKSIADQINDFFITEYSQGQSNVDPHAGSAFVTGTYQQCCSLQLHVNTCDANFKLLDENSDPIAATTSNNPFTTYGTKANDANCVDCGDDIGTKASGTLTLSANISDTETVTIGTKVYTFQDTLTNVDGNVHIGATAEETADNLRNAINGGPGAGTDYATAMTVHPDVTAQDGAGTTVVIQANAEGIAGNSIATTETSATASFGASTLTGGVDGTLGSVTFPCGVRIIAEQVKGDCNTPYLPKTKAFYGRKLNILPYGDGFDSASWLVAEVQAMELPAGFGAWIQHLEYQTEPDGRGRGYDRSNINKGHYNTPGNKARIRNAYTARCDKNYCSYYMKSHVEKRRLSRDYGVLNIHSNLHIPNTDSTTITSWETFWAAVIALNPTCKTLTAVNCTTSLGGC